ncbi:MAG: hypothetical protein CME88_05610 [Hirschia sp.]|nr:hypothetical protein [Hirschia sp.]MBF17840.1 hypothetical protein [Hirschia sp.]|tara:strand:- start:131 stop:382 length:252 start_codon:yes stop_codon:yes gene_type:complete
MPGKIIRNASTLVISVLAVASSVAMPTLEVDGQSAGLSNAISGYADVEFVIYAQQARENEPSTMIDAQMASSLTRWSIVNETE